MKKIFLILFFTVISIELILSQISSRNGYQLTNTGTVRVLVVFAEAVNDPQYSIEYAMWPSGSMPLNKDDYFDPTYNSALINGFMTKYFDQLSFSQYQVIK